MIPDQHCCYYSNNFRIVSFSQTKVSGKDSAFLNFDRVNGKSYITDTFTCPEGGYKRFNNYGIIGLLEASFLGYIVFVTRRVQVAKLGQCCVYQIQEVDCMPV